MPTLSLPAHQSPPLLRRVVVAAVLVAYALPLSLNALSGLSHGAFHMLERVQERQARAAAMGLVHLSEQGRERSTFVHTHDGSTHAHAGPVDALLSASDHADDQQDVAAPVVPAVWPAFHSQSQTDAAVGATSGPGTGGSVHAPSHDQFQVHAPFGAPEVPGTATATLTFEPPVTVTLLWPALVPVAVAVFPW